MTVPRPLAANATVTNDPTTRELIVRPAADESGTARLAWRGGRSSACAGRGRPQPHHVPAHRRGASLGEGRRSGPHRPRGARRRRKSALPFRTRRQHLQGARLHVPARDCDGRPRIEADPRCQLPRLAGGLGLVGSMGVNLASPGKNGVRATAALESWKEGRTGVYSFLTPATRPAPRPDRPQSPRSHARRPRAGRVETPESG
jgi:hypothetical protein